MSSGRKVHWVCHSHATPHRWSATVKNRTKTLHPTKCPRCSRREARHTSELWSLLVLLTSAPLLVSACQACRSICVSEVYAAA